MATLSIEIIPRAPFRAYLARTQRWAIMVVHRRGGKTFACVQDLFAKAMTYKRKGPPLAYAYVAPTKDQAKKIIWGYVVRSFGAVPGVILNRAELLVTLPNKATLQLYSGEEYERMRGLYFDGVVIDEYADIDPNAWPAVIRATLSDYEGWATFIGTPKGRNAYYKAWVHALKNPETWFSLMLKSSESGFIAPDEIADIKTTTPDPIFQQEYECDFSIGRPGAIYVRALDDALQKGRISDNVLHFDQVPVYTTFDVGAALNQRVWIWQLVGDRINFLESLSGGEDIETPADWADVLRNKGYAYGSHFIPHDAAAENGGLWQSALGTAGLSHVVPVPRQIWVWDGINSALGNLPRCYFAATGCRSGLEALEAYHSRQERDGATIKDQPVHDWSSHFADAFSLAHQAISRGMVLDRSATPRRPKLSRNASVIMGFRGSDGPKRRNLIDTL
jgi:phage terminase large subunit